MTFGDTQLPQVELCRKTEHRSVSIPGIQDEMYIYGNEEQRKISTGMDPLPKVATYCVNPCHTAK